MMDLLPAAAENHFLLHDEQGDEDCHGDHRLFSRKNSFQKTQQLFMSPYSELTELGKFVALGWYSMGRSVVLVQFHSTIFVLTEDNTWCIYLKSLTANDSAPLFFSQLYWSQWTCASGFAYCLSVCCFSFIRSCWCLQVLLSDYLTCGTWFFVFTKGAKHWHRWVLTTKIIAFPLQRMLVTQHSLS